MDCISAAGAQLGQILGHTHVCWKVLREVAGLRVRVDWYLALGSPGVGAGVCAQMISLLLYTMPARALPGASLDTPHASLHALLHAVTAPAQSHVTLQ